MERKALTDKILVLGIDGFEPRLAKKYLTEGNMPNLAAFMHRGSAREDLVLLGAMPTVTPPLWTTLATGAYPNTHGITCFFGQHPDHLDELVYNLDSRRCKAEPLWNVFAEDAHKPTLVWHWPGSSWPPTSDSPYLAVVEGTQPPIINLGVANVDIIKFVYAKESIQELQYLPNKVDISSGAGCIIDDVEALLADNDSETGASFNRDQILKGIEHQDKGIRTLLMGEKDAEVNVLQEMAADTILSPVAAPQGWPMALPAGAKEFYFYVSGGLEKRAGLILPNQAGVYDTVTLYKSKRETEPYVTLQGTEPAYDVLDTVKNQSGETIACTRNYQAIALEADGSQLTLLVNMAMDISRDDFFHPKSLYQEIIQNYGYIPTPFRINGINERLVEKSMIPSWDHYCQWQADCLTGFMEQERFEVIFSHLHNVDSMGHFFWHYGKHQDYWGNNEAAYQGFFREVYQQTDAYIGRFLPYLDQGWTIIVTSDHGLLTSENHGVILGEMNGVNVPVMKELGYTILKRDDAGREIAEIDWSKTRAIAARGDYIYLNLKGRNRDGIVKPEEQYDLEEQIITDLYNYRDPKTGKRVVAVAMRNKEAALLGMSGPECGDIIYFCTESYNIIHADSMSTHYGCAETSVSPIFLAAGPGIKEDYITDRVIRQVDVAPTMAVLGGVRMPAQCEGAPIYQILTETY